MSPDLSALVLFLGCNKAGRTKNIILLNKAGPKSRSKACFPDKSGISDRNSLLHLDWDWSSAKSQNILSRRVNMQTTLL